MSTGSAAIDLILVGHLAKDEVVVRGEERVRQGGAVYFGAFAARAAGARCLVVTKLADEDRPLLRSFADAGIEVHATRSAHTAGIRNIYTTADQDRRQCLLLHAGDPLRLEEIPPVPARIIHVGALLAGQVPEALLEPLAARAPLGLDVQGFLRVDEGDELRLRPWPGAEASLRHVTYLKADAAEAEVLTGLTDRPRAAEALARLGPREVVLTHATEVLVLADGQLHRAPFDPVSLEGRTGRGDTCMAAYLAARALGQPAAWATRYTAALTSLKLEVDGPFGGTDAQVRARMTA
jgi:sugar/nucleoside kinase (ribokinase family)